MQLIAHLALELDRDNLDEAYAAVAEALKETHAFDGCVDVTVLVDHTDPSRVLVVEVWRSVEHDAAYRAWRAGPGTPTRLRAALAGPPSLRRFVATDVS